MEIYTPEEIAEIARAYVNYCIALVNVGRAPCHMIKEAEIDKMKYAMGKIPPSVANILGRLEETIKREEEKIRSKF